MRLFITVLADGYSEPVVTFHGVGHDWEIRGNERWLITKSAQIGAEYTRGTGTTGLYGADDRLPSEADADDR